MCQTSSILINIIIKVLLKVLFICHFNTIPVSVLWYQYDTILSIRYISLLVCYQSLPHLTNHISAQHVSPECHSWWTWQDEDDVVDYFVHLHLIMVRNSFLNFVPLRQYKKKLIEWFSPVKMYAGAHNMPVDICRKNCIALENISYIFITYPKVQFTGL